MADRRLYLIRHAQVDPVRGLPAPEWPLTAEGRCTAELLGRAREWRSLALVASSPEPKALATATPIAETAGVRLGVEPDLREAERPGMPIVTADAYRAMVGEFFASPDASVHGWERARDVQARVRACIDRLARETPGHLAVVSHGLALSLYLASLDGRRSPSLAIWAAIDLPAVAVVDPDGGRLLAPFRSAETFLC